MDRITRDTLVILLSQQQKFRNDIESLRRELMVESDLALKTMRLMAEILPAAQQLDDPDQKKEAMDALFLVLEKSEIQPEVDRAVAKMETANDTLAARTLDLIAMLKSMEFGEKEA